MVTDTATAAPVRFGLVTASLNAGPWIRDTIESILGQSAIASGRVSLDYVIRDGGSTDETVSVVRALADEAADIPNVSIRLVSAEDGGLYDALAQGFDGLEADVFGWLNAGDYYSRTCFDIVCDVMSPPVEWITGLGVIYNARGDVIQSRTPGPYPAALIRAGYFAPGRGFPPVQQESTFWSSRLQQSIDIARFREFRLAGDAYLWNSFAKQADLYVVNAHLGGFRLHGGHLSSAMDRYLAELDSFREPATLRTRLVALRTRLVWMLPRRPRLLVSGGSILSWSTRSGRYRGVTMSDARSDLGRRLLPHRPRRQPKTDDQHEEGSARG